MAPSVPLLVVTFLALTAVSIEGRYLAGVVQHVALEAATPKETLAANLAVYKAKKSFFFLQKFYF